jgi:hypothetical protein
MFERYTEQARRVIFFARYHASEFGRPVIETEHLLLGLLREDRALALRLAARNATPEVFRKLIEEQAKDRENVPTSTDLPLSADSRQVLAFAADSAETLGHHTIDTGHLTLGLLRLPQTLAARFLDTNGVDFESYQEVIRSTAQEAAPPPEEPAATPAALQRADEWELAEMPPPAAPTLSQPIRMLMVQVLLAVRNMDLHSEAYALRHLKRRPWTRKEAMGHLVDLAAAHLTWMARAMTEPHLTTAGMPADDWVAAQRYAEYDWCSLVALWVSLNRLLTHTLAAIPEEKLAMACQIGIGGPESLLTVIERYIRECEDLIGQIMAKL